MTDQPGPQDPQQPANPPTPDPYAATPPPPPPPPPAPAYGTPPPPPAAPQQPAYGTPAPAPQQPGYGSMPPAGYSPTPSLPYASWGNRVVGALIDYFAPAIVAGAIYQGNHALGFILQLGVLAWALYNKVLEGRTGQSVGKKVAGTTLVGAATGQVVGPGLAIGRYFLHILDALPCYLGFLWPLWDAKRQTFADKIVNTYVLKV